MSFFRSAIHEALPPFAILLLGLSASACETPIPPAAAAGSAGSSISAKAPTVGQRLVESHSFQLKTEHEEARMPAPMPTKTTRLEAWRYQRALRVLAVKAGVVTRLEVRYLAATTTRLAGGSLKTSDAAVKGKTYTLSLASGRLKASRGTQPIKAAELALLRKFHEGFGKRTALQRALGRWRGPDAGPLASKPATIAAILGLPQLAFGAYVQRPGGAGLLLPTDKSAGPKLAAFSLMVGYQLPMDPQGGPMGMTSVKGSLTIQRATGWPTRLTASGTVAVSDGNPERMITVSGKLTIARSWAYK